MFLLEFESCQSLACSYRALDVKAVKAVVLHHSRRLADTEGHYTSRLLMPPEADTESATSWGTDDGRQALKSSLDASRDISSSVSFRTLRPGQGRLPDNTAPGVRERYVLGTAMHDVGEHAADALRTMHSYVHLARPSNALDSQVSHGRLPVHTKCAQRISVWEVTWVCWAIRSGTHPMWFECS